MPCIHQSFKFNFKKNEIDSIIRRASKYNDEMLGVQYKFESPSTTFWASHCYIMMAHGMRAKHWVMI